MLKPASSNVRAASTQQNLSEYATENVLLLPARYLERNSSRARSAGRSYYAARSPKITNRAAKRPLRHRCGLPIFQGIVPRLHSIDAGSLEKDGMRIADRICPLLRRPSHSFSKYALSSSVHAATIASRADSKQPGRVLQLLKDGGTPPENTRAQRKAVVEGPLRMDPAQEVQDFRFSFLDIGRRQLQAPFGAPGYQPSAAVWRQLRQGSPWKLAVLRDHGRCRGSSTGPPLQGCRRALLQRCEYARGRHPYF